MSDVKFEKSMTYKEFIKAKRASNARKKASAMSRLYNSNKKKK
jgi:hypothetical protein